MKMNRYLLSFPSDSTLVVHYHNCVIFLKDYCVQRVSLSTMNDLINEDNEPYSQNHHLGPYTARSYETITDYVPNEYLDEEETTSIWRKLANPTVGMGCECVDGRRAELDHLTWRFISTCPCAASNRACDEKCHNGASHCGCQNQLCETSSLRLGEALKLIDSWGIDCYSRDLIQLLLSRYSVSLGTVSHFIHHCLLPTISRIPGGYASDIR